MPYREQDCALETRPPPSTCPQGPWLAISSHMEKSSFRVSHVKNPPQVHSAVVHTVSLKSLHPWPGPSSLLLATGCPGKLHSLSPQWGVLVSSSCYTTKAKCWVLIQEKSIAHDSGGQKSKMEVWAGLVSSEASLLAQRYHLCLFTWPFLLCVCES